MKFIVKALLLAGGFYGAIAAIGFALVLVLMQTDPTEFSGMGISPDAKHWQLKSITHYTVWASAYVIFYAVYSFLNFRAYKKRNIDLAIIMLVISAVIVGMMIRYYTLLKASGYDHYPGFDPYLL